MSHAEEIAKQDSIRVKITWKTGDAKHEVEFDARAIEWKRNAREGSYKTWQLTLLEVPRFFNVEEGTPSAPAPAPPAAWEGRAAIRPHYDLQFLGFDPAGRALTIDQHSVVRLADIPLRGNHEPRSPR